MDALNEIRLAIHADELQFYIQDESADGGSSEMWTAKAGEILLATADRMIGVGTLRNTFVPVTIKTFAAEPPFLTFNDNVIDQINECDLEVSSGKIIIAGIFDDFECAKRIEIKKGIYRARIYYGNLDKLDEFYAIHLWLTKKRQDLKIVKSRQAKIWHELFKKEGIYSYGVDFNYN